MVLLPAALRELAVVIGISTLFGCGSKRASSPEAERGREIYMVNCIACHNPNPELSGPLGPPVKGSSHELIEARLVRGEYPAGYLPKRKTKQMVPMPQLASHVSELAAYLK